MDKPLDMLLSWGLMARQEEGEETLYSVHTKVRDFVGREADGDRPKLQVRAAQYYERKAKACGDLWDHLRARDYYYQAEEWETAANMVIGVSHYLYRWGYIKLVIGLLQQSADTTSSATKAMALGELAIVYQEMGDWQTALNICTEIKDIFERLGDKGCIANCLHQIGMIYQHHGDYSEAIDLYQQSLDLSMDVGDKYGIASTLHQLGNIYYFQRNYTEAMKFYQRSLEIAKELRLRWGTNITLHQLGLVQEEQAGGPAGG